MSYQIKFIRILTPDTGTDQFPNGLVDFSLTLDFTKLVNFT